MTNGRPLVTKVALSRQTREPVGPVDTVGPADWTPTGRSGDTVGPRRHGDCARSQPLIVRVFRARIRHDSESMVLDDMRDGSNQDWDGLVARYAAHRVQAGQVVTMNISVWRDLDALHAWAGPRLEVPVLASHILDAIEEWSIEHFEVFEDQPGPNELRILGELGAQ